MTSLYGAPLCAKSSGRDRPGETPLVRAKWLATRSLAFALNVPLARDIFRPTAIFSVRRLQRHANLPWIAPDLFGQQAEARPGSTMGCARVSREMSVTRPDQGFPGRGAEPEL